MKIVYIGQNEDASLNMEWAIDIICDMMDDDVDSSPSIHTIMRPNDIWKDLNDA